MYGFMLNVHKSNNLNLSSIVHCDILFTYPLWNTGDSYCIYTRSSRKPHSNYTLYFLVGEARAICDVGHYGKSL